MKMIDCRRHSAFTLLELLLVVAIIAVLATLFLLAVNPLRQLADSRDAVRLNDLHSLRSALTQYLLEHRGAYPSTLSSVLREICRSGVTASDCLADGRLYLGQLEEDQKYLVRLPEDPLVEGSGGSGYWAAITSAGQLVLSAPQAERAVVAIGNPAGTGVVNDVSLVGWWKFDEPDGVTVYDSSGYQQHGTMYSAASGANKILPTRVSGISGRALSFVNTLATSTRRLQGVSIPHNATTSPYNFKNGSNFTLSVWFLYPQRLLGGFDGIRNSFNLLGKYYKYSIFVEDRPPSQGGALRLAAGLRTASSTWPFYRYTVNSGTWQHGVMTIQANGLNGATLRLYINGLRVGQSTVNNFNSYPFDSSTTQLYFGNDRTLGGNPDFFNGLIDEVRIYNRTLSDLEVLALYNLHKP